MVRIARTLLTAVVTAFTLTACNDEDPLTVQSPETIIYDASLGINLSTMARSSTGLYSKDLIVGEGAEAVNGKTIAVRYTGYLNNGVAFDGTSAGATFSFKLGNDEVIQGWDEGLVGMKIGGRRLLIIPPALGYGTVRNDPIPPGSVLIFAVELVTVSN